MIASMQKAAPKTRHRRYWTADGMVGSNPKFGSIDQLSIATRKQQQVITRARMRVLIRLRRYEKRFPKRRGLIHADIHFGNLLVTDRGLAAIDFDDCGYGILAYDLAVVLLAIERQFNERDPVKISELREKLIAGYKTILPWDSHDDAILDDLVYARKLMMLGWLNSRVDNPRLAKHFKKSLPSVVKEIRRLD
jgi:Ser/Thr protein kinase RdoA (MazF antagonist)